ncbi:MULTISPECIES: hypothetical protein [Aeromonas]|uniref:hypothetical protein n=1 Tax=Aeromonas TaxID=642 RepID=UPI001119357F|nr:hypothetical protein [Aeromonas dhakensis]
MSILDRPDPHPLDFDWRFDEESTKRIINLFSGNTNVLCLGTPSVSSRLSGDNYILVDWHPFQTVENHLRVNINQHSPIITNSDYVIMDPPWYLDIYLRWISWACNSVKPNTKILFPIWPDETRPDAINEKKQLFDWLNIWGEYSLSKNFISYETPYFEILSNVKSKTKPKPRVADLVTFTFHSSPPLLDPIANNDTWVRYVFDNYQLAIRVTNSTYSESNEKIEIQFINGMKDWVWPSVSKRAIGRENINIWSSNNEVGIVNNTQNLISLLDKAIESGFYEEDRSTLGELINWNIPLPPYKRIIKWNQRN